MALIDSQARLGLLVGAATLLFANRADAVRPFVTDDGRIAARGQIEGETWLELSRPDGRVLPIYNALLNIEPLEWLELGVAMGVGWAEGQSLTFTNPGAQAKILFTRPVSDRYPGVAFVVGALFPLGRGSASSEETGFYAIVPSTLSLLDGDIDIHANLGWLAARLPDGTFEQRPFWGIGADVALGVPEFRAIGEAFAGDPSDSLGPRLGFQAGARWLPSDYINVDLALGVSPKAGFAFDDGAETSVQIGFRFLIDAFTGDEAVDPEGGRGMF